MSTSLSGQYSQSVKGATKSKLAAPKSKYIHALLDATSHGEAHLNEIFRALHPRFKDTQWTVVFKSLIVTHLMIRDGYKDEVLDYMTTSNTFRPTILTSTGCSPMSDQGKNINEYGTYLLARVRAFGSVKYDYVKNRNEASGKGRLRSLTVDKGLLRETEIVQNLIGPLISCRNLEKDVTNEIALAAFKLLVADLLVLFQVANEAVINVLEHYFEMTRVDAERALKIYERFVTQTDGVIEYMTLARSLESVTRLKIPNLQHAPTSLGESLEEYVKDPDFEQNRIQYLATKGKQPASSSTTQNTRNHSIPLKSALKTNNTANGTSSNPFQASQLPPQMASSANTDLIDFFDSISPPPQQAQQQFQTYPAQPQHASIQPQFTANPYLQQQQHQQQQPIPQVQQIPQQYTGYQIQQQTGQNPYLQQQAYSQPAYPPQQQQLPIQATGAGFGGYTAQPVKIQPQYTNLQPQQTGSNPFRQSMMMPQSTGYTSAPSIVSPQRTGNPFQRTNSIHHAAAPQRPQTTGNPFQQAQQPQMIPQQTGSNPFRKSIYQS